MTTPLKSRGCVVASDNVTDIMLSGSACSEFVTNSPVDTTLRSEQVDSAVLPQGLSIVRGLVSAKFSVRVLARLAEAEQKTEVATEQQNYRIAWLTVLRADEGNPDPWKQAFWEIVGNTPEKAIPFWLCRDDLLHDEYVPLHLLELRYTKDWGSDYVHAKMIAEKARSAGLPPKKPVEFAPIPFPVRAQKKTRKREGGIGSWSAIAFCVFVIVVVTIWITGRTRKTYFYQYPSNYLRIVQNVDPYSFVVQRVENGTPMEETEMHFCRDFQPRFENGHILRWIRFTDIGSCQTVGPEDHGYDILRDANRLPVLAPNCKPDWAANHVACEGGKARF